MNLTYYHLSSWLLNYSIHVLNLIENSKKFPIDSGLIPYIPHLVNNSLIRCIACIFLVGSSNILLISFRTATGSKSDSFGITTTP